MPPIHEFAEMKLTRRVGMIWWGAFLIAAAGTGSAGMVTWVMVNGPPQFVQGETWAPIVFGFISTTASLTVGIALMALSRYGTDRTFVRRERPRPPTKADPGRPGNPAT